MKILKLSNKINVKVCDLSTPTVIVNVFKSVSEAEDFRAYLSDGLMTGATVGGEKVIPPFNDMSYTVDDNNRVTAKYFAKAEEIVEDDILTDESEEVAE